MGKKQQKVNKKSTKKAGKKQEKSRNFLTISGTDSGTLFFSKSVFWCWVVRWFHTLNFNGTFIYFNTS